MSGYIILGAWLFVVAFAFFAIWADDQNAKRGDGE